MRTSSRLAHTARIDKGLHVGQRLLYGHTDDVEFERRQGLGRKIFGNLNVRSGNFLSPFFLSFCAFRAEINTDKSEILLLYADISAKHFRFVFLRAHALHNAFLIDIFDKYLIARFQLIRLRGNVLRAGKLFPFVIVSFIAQAVFQSPRLDEIGFRNVFLGENFFDFSEKLFRFRRAFVDDPSRFRFRGGEQLFFFLLKSFPFPRREVGSFPAIPISGGWFPLEASSAAIRLSSALRTIFSKICAPSDRLPKRVFQNFFFEPQRLEMARALLDPGRPILMTYQGTETCRNRIPCRRFRFRPWKRQIPSGRNNASSPRPSIPF